MLVSLNKEWRLLLCAIIIIFIITWFGGTSADKENLQLFLQIDFDR